MGRTDIGVGHFCLRSQNTGAILLPPALPGPPDTVRGTGPSIEGPQLSEEKGCAALRCGFRGLQR